MTDSYIIEDITFGSLTKEQIDDIFTDGRIASHFLERQLEIWYPKLTFVDGRGHDHVDEEGNLYDQKCLLRVDLHLHHLI